MNRFDGLEDVPGGNPEPTRDELERRLRELESENRRLRTDLEKTRLDWRVDRQELQFYYSMGFPATEEELLERTKSAPTLREVLDELNREYGV